MVLLITNGDRTITSFDIGYTEGAQRASQAYDAYKTSKKFEDLKNCFTELYKEAKVSDQQLSICLACNCIASSVFEECMDLTICQKNFISKHALRLIDELSNIDKLSQSLCISLLIAREKWDQNLKDYTKKNTTHILSTV